MFVQYSDDEVSDEEEKIRARKLDAGGNPWVLGGTSNLAGRVPPPRVRYRKEKVVDMSLPGSKHPAGTIPQVCHRLKVPTFWSFYFCCSTRRVEPPLPTCYHRCCKISGHFYTKGACMPFLIPLLAIFGKQFDDCQFP